MTTETERAIDDDTSRSRIEHAQDVIEQNRDVAGFTFHFTRFIKSSTAARNCES